MGLERTTSFSRERLALPACTRVLDRGGALLRFLPGPDGTRHLPAGQVPPVVARAFVAAEDQRFYDHPGFDPLAIVRALRQNLSRGRVVSGASTITQQLSRLAYPRPRTYPAKALEIARAARIELALSKPEILALYLDRVPLGNNLLGVEAASRVYFGKGCGELSAPEAALLAALARAPGRLDPYGPRRGDLLRRQARVLELMGEPAPSAPPALVPRSFPFEAPHFVDALKGRLPPGDALSTLDLPLQRRVEEVLLSHRTRLAWRGASQAAAVVLDNRTMEVLALAGSFEYGGRDGGFNDGTRALRSPGSVLKPFFYAQALDAGLTASSVLEDLDRRYRSVQGEYAPVNFDRRSYGPVSLREALGSSLNLSAVNLLNQMGAEPFYRRLQRLSLINHPERGAEHYGLGLVVGNPEVSLLQVTQAFACLAAGGVFRPVRLLASDPAPAGERIYSEQASFVIADILSDPSARDITFGRALDLPFPAAVKTGTSTHSRDCWAVGYTPRHTVGVWVGNFPGFPTWNLSGAGGAAPLLGDILRQLYPRGDAPRFARPEGVSSVRVCTFSGALPLPACPQVKEELFLEGMEPAERCRFHLRGGAEHLLPAPYAGWVHDRSGRGSAGRFGVEGEVPSPDPAAGSGLRAAVVGGRKAPARTASGAWILEEEPPFLPPPPGREAGVRILYPLEGDRFLLGGRGRGDTVIRLSADCQRVVPTLTWFVDGREVATVGPPYRTEWTLTRGEHSVSAVAPDHTGDRVTIFVE